MTFKLAFKHIFSKPFLSVFTLFGVVAALTVLGAFWTVVENLERVRVSEPTQASIGAAPGVTLFVDSKAPASEVQALKARLELDKRFSGLEVIGSEEALKSLEKQFGETLGQAFSGESLPLTFKLTFSSQGMSQAEYAALLTEMRELPSVLDVDDGQHVFPGRADGLSSKVFSWANTMLIVVFSIVALLVSHLVRIAFETLRPEVETMKILGASRFWIFKPLFLEGIFFGISGAIVSLICLSIMVQVFLPKFAAALLPHGLEIRSLSMSGSMGLLGLSLVASIIGAFFTWPLINQSPKEI